MLINPPDKPLSIAALLGKKTPDVNINELFPWETHKENNHSVKALCRLSLVLPKDNSDVVLTFTTLT